MISEDDGNNSFLQKSEGQDETKENSRNITSTFDREGQQTQDNTHLSETSEMRDEIKDYTEFTNTLYNGW